MKYRSRTDIISKILDTANGGATKTKIMYQAFLSFAQVKVYARALTENNLLNYDAYTQTFKTIEKGHYEMAFSILFPQGLRKASLSGIIINLYSFHLYTNFRSLYLTT